jgi:hypothetical protein
MASTTYVARRPGPFAALIQVSQLGGFRLEPMAPLRTTDQYWDTEDGELLRSGLALRVREQGGRRTASVRAIRQTDSGPEADASATDLPPDDGSGALALPAGLLADTIEALTGADPLHLLLTLRQYRTPRIVFDGDRAVALASFDVVAYDAQGRQIVSNEVEVDLAERGTAQDLARLDTLLRLHDLEPEPLSKLERGVVRLPRTPSQPLLLLPSERDHLEAVAAGDDALRSRRARVILLDARGFRADTVAAQTGLSTGRVRHWKQRFLDERMGLFAADGAFAARVRTWTSRPWRTLRRRARRRAWRCPPRRRSAGPAMAPITPSPPTRSTTPATPRTWTACWRSSSLEPRTRHCCRSRARRRTRTMRWTCKRRSTRARRRW